MNEAAKRTIASKKTHARSLLNARSIVQASGLSNGDHVIVEYRGSVDHPFRREEGFIRDGEITVGGCTPSRGMIGEILSQPYRLSGGDFSRIATLADGSVLRQSTAKNDREWLDESGNVVDFTETILSRTPV